MLSYLWGGKKAANAPAENEDPMVAIENAMDAHGEFATRTDGSLEFADFLVLRAIIFRQAGRAFAPKKKELQVKKIEALKAKDHQEYISIFKQGMMDHQLGLAACAKKACEYIEMSHENYQNSNKLWMQDQSKAQEIMTKDVAIRAALDHKEVVKSLEEMMEASKFKYTKEIKMFRTLESLKTYKNQKDMQEIHQIEMSKISDMLCITFGMDLTEFS